MNVIGIAVLLVITSLVGVLIWLAYNFHKYKGKLYAKILQKSGNAQRVEITGEIGTFEYKDKSYMVERAKSYMDHWIFPRNTIYYFEDRSRPISMEESEEEDGEPEVVDKNIGPVELNNIMKTKFTDLFKTQSQGVFDGFSISKRWLVVIAIVVVIIVLLVIYGPELFGNFLGGGGPVKPVEPTPPSPNGG